jgi:hypothetical protein
MFFLHGGVGRGEREREKKWVPVSRKVKNFESFFNTWQLITDLHSA